MTSTPNERPMESSTSAQMLPPDAAMSDPTSDYPQAGEEVTDTGAPAYVFDAPVADDDLGSTADVAKQETAAVKDTAVEAGTNVAETAKDEAANVAAETKVQAKGLLESVSSQVNEQAGAQQSRIAETVKGLAGELETMVSGSQERGPLTDLARQGADRGGQIAHWLDQHEPADLLTEVKSFARRRPVVFLALCGAAGVLAGRLARGAVGANTSLDSPDSGGSVDRPAVTGGPSASLVEEPAVGDAHPDPYLADPELSSANPAGAPTMTGPGFDPAPTAAEVSGARPDVAR